HSEVVPGISAIRSSTAVDSILIRLQLPVADLCSAHCPDELFAVIQMPPRPSGAIAIGSTSPGTRTRDHPRLVIWTRRGWNAFVWTVPTAQTSCLVTAVIALN